MIKRGISLIFLLIIGFSVLAAQEIVTAESYLRMVSDVYASLRDYEASVIIRSGGSNMAGNVSFRSPNLLRIDFSQPANQVIVFNGDSLVVYLPEFRAVLNQEVNRRTAQSGSGLSMLIRNFTPTFLTGPNPEPLDSGSSERVIKLRLTRRFTSEGFRELILSINPDTRLIRRIEGRTIAEVDVRIDFTSIRTNVGVPVARFEYDTPPNSNMYNNFLFRDTD
ncbi:MAG: outer-membrane lipoprotein carrier protein LolA [Treponema sp.]|nr:outer-membrane lipoprotein carrier protein LolA [Treponema sp.]